MDKYVQKSGCFTNGRNFSANYHEGIYLKSMFGISRWVASSKAR